MADPVWSTACQDWERRILASESLIPFAPLFPDEAQSALDLFGTLKLVDATGEPTMAEVARPWVVEFVAAIFGAYNPATGRRLINEFLMLISKKNGKSTLAAGIMLVALVQNWRKSGEFLILAPTKEIADNSFTPIKDMIRADEGLSELLHIQENTRTVRHRKTGATLKVVAADAETVSGKKAIGVFVDELHEFGKKARAGNMLLEATGGLASRPEGFVIYASTQSEIPPAGVFKQKLQYARKVRDGEINDPKFLPVLYEFPQEMIDAKAYLDLENAYVTNPNWGASVDVERVTQLFHQFQAEGEDGMREFLAKHLNVQVTMALSADRWAGADFWQAAGDKTLTFYALLERSEVVVVGIDGGGLDDLLGLSVIGRCKKTRKWLHWAHAWAHEIVFERRKDIAPRLRDFERDGDLTVVKKPGDDVRAVADIICSIRDAKLLPSKNSIGVDAAGIGAIVEELLSPGRGFTDDHILAISQGWKLNGAIKTVERMVAGGDFTHGATDMMSWCVSNAKVVQVGNAITINKQVSGTAKIDPLMATFDAATLMAENPTAKNKTLVLATAG